MPQLSLWGRHNDKTDPGFLGNHSSTFKNDSAAANPKWLSYGATRGVDTVTLGNDTRNDFPFC